jgi:hypothetical protein
MIMWDSHGVAYEAYYVSKYGVISGYTIRSASPNKLQPIRSIKTDFLYFCLISQAQLIKSHHRVSVNVVQKLTNIRVGRCYKIPKIYVHLL